MELDELVWDDFNSEHISKHNVTRIEVEEACRNQLFVLASYKGRKMLFGKTSAGRRLTIILSPEVGKGKYYVVTTRDSSKKERRLTDEKNQNKKDSGI